MLGQQHAGRGSASSRWARGSRQLRPGKLLPCRTASKQVPVLDKVSVPSFGLQQRTAEAKNQKLAEEQLNVQAPELPQAAPEGTIEDVRAYQKQLFTKLLAFLGPALCIPIADPLMSFVDTVCIGQFAGTEQLAALGPAMLVFSFAQYIFQSLQVATLSLVAGHMNDVPATDAVSMSSTSGAASTSSSIGSATTSEALLGHASTSGSSTASTNGKLSLTHSASTSHNPSTTTDLTQTTSASTSHNTHSSDMAATHLSSSSAHSSVSLNNSSSHALTTSTSTLDSHAASTSTSSSSVFAAASHSEASSSFSSHSTSSSSSSMALTTRPVAAVSDTASTSSSETSTSISINNSSSASGLKGIAAAEESWSTAVFLAIAFGLTTMGVLEGFTDQFIMATGLQDLSLAPLSEEYLRIRAISQPAVLVTMVCQSGLLAQKDSATPASTVILATTVSFLGNLVFVAGMGWGLEGAALTTVATQYIGAAVLLWAASTRGKAKLHIRVPSFQSTTRVLTTMAPLAVSYTCKNACYLVIQTTAAILPVLPLAAHQAVFSVWNLMAYTVAPVEQSAMTFLPGSPPGWQRSAAIGLLSGLGVLVGAVGGAGLLGTLLYTPGIFTPDEAVWPYIQSVSTQTGIVQVLIGVDMVSSGINIALGDAAYVARSFIFTLAALASYMWVCREQGWGLEGVWWGIVLFFIVRSAQSMGRLALKNWK